MTCDMTVAGAATRRAERAQAARAEPDFHLS